MTKTNKPARPQSQGQDSKRKRDGILKEAWTNMASDFDRLLPEKLRRRKDKKAFALWLLILELAVLGVIGKFVYAWWVTR